MHFSVLNLVLCVAVPAIWTAVGWYCRHGERRRARHRAEWARAAPGLRDLETGLEQVWAAESRRTRWPG